MFKRTIKSLEDSIEGYLQEAQAIEASGVWIAISGIILFLFIRFAQGVLANSILEKRFSEWLSNKLNDKTNLELLLIFSNSWI